LLEGSGIVLPISAYKRPGGELKSWITNQLNIGFIRTIYGTPQWKGAFHSRTTLYESWARYMIDQSFARISIPYESLKNFFETVALDLLEERKTAMLFSPDLQKVMRLTLEGPVLQDGQVFAAEILGPSSNRKEVMFCHESVYEFFTAWTVKNEFVDIVTSDLNNTDFERCRLAMVSLDYLQASAYGFLSELFEMLPFNFFHKLKNWLKCFIETQQHGGPKIPEKLLRNLVECVGMIYLGEDDSDITEHLLSMIDNTAIGVTVRFNTARALERVHPQSPRPYFDYISDWGAGDWSAERKRATNRKETPFVMLGAKRETATPGRQYAYTPRPELINRKDILQKNVSTKLGDIIDKLLADHEEKKDESPIRINCTNTWLKWYHPSQKNLLFNLCKIAKEKRIEKETLHNLDLIWKIANSS
jgi:hypothetical protein